MFVEGVQGGQTILQRLITLYDMIAHMKLASRSVMGDIAVSPQLALSPPPTQSRPNAYQHLLENAVSANCMVATCQAPEFCAKNAPAGNDLAPQTPRFNLDAARG